jgi:hypothetical protein
MGPARHSATPAGTTGRKDTIIMDSSYSIEGWDGVISGGGMTYQTACREAQRLADQTGQTWHVVDEDGYREPVEPCGAAA